MKANSNSKEEEVVMSRFIISQNSYWNM